MLVDQAERIFQALFTSQKGASKPAIVLVLAELL
jgi:hypothetical protein